DRHSPYRYASALQFSEDGRKLPRPLHCLCTVGRCQSIGTIAPESRSTRLGRRESRLGPLADLFTLMLGECRQHMHHELVGMWIVGCDEIHTAFHKAGDEMHVSS